MCGICGRLGGNIDRDTLQRATDKMIHRGPNQSGYYITEKIGLGHRRLSIIDLSDCGKQPMFNEDRSISMVYNGEIYNFQELSKQLQSKHDFISKTDSEVLVHGYEEWGIEGLLKRIRGMFVFAIWDSKQEKLHLARDHFGKKPLYYCQKKDGFYFSSTLPSLLELLKEIPALNYDAIFYYLNQFSVPWPYSIFEGVCKLPPSNRMEITNTNVKTIPYWDIDFSKKDNIASEKEWISKIDECLRSAVKDRLVADVPVGAFLSGGVDSSLVVAIASELKPSPLKTISIGFKDGELSELSYAKKVAQKFDTEHYEYTLSPNVLGILPELIYNYGEPFADHSAIPTYYVSKIASEHVKVVLTGDGGDENFAGYLNFLALKAVSKIQSVIGKKGFENIDRILDYLEALDIKSLNKMRWITQYGIKGKHVLDPIGRKSFRNRHSCLFSEHFLKNMTTNNSDQLYSQIWNENEELDWVDRALLIDFKRQLPDTYLTKVDVATMANSIEARSPFLDKKFVELTSQIPSDLKLKRWKTKYLLKKVGEKYLPDEILYRRKHGFSLPISKWLKNDSSDLLEEVLLSSKAASRKLFNINYVQELISEHKEGKIDHGQRLWSLLVLELWFLMFVDNSLRRSSDLGKNI